MRLLLEKIRKILHDRKAKQMLTRIVSTFAAVVVFITTYALVLPAITMESQADCGIPAHQHDDSCYEEVLVCGLEESEEHQHDASCYEKQLVCCMEAHTHSAACYSQASGGGDVGADGGGGSSAEDYAVVAATTEPANGSASGAGNTDAKTSGSDFNVDGSTDAIDGDVTDATVDAGAGLSSPSASEEAYVPELESLLFDQLLTNKTGIYYFHPEEGKTIPENTADITEWTRVKDDTDLAPADMLRVYLRYTIPAGALNSTNPVARYRLPANLHLTDQQIEEINTTVNGIANQYINLDTLEILDPDQYNQYLGIEAVEGTRTPSDDINEYFAKHSDMNGQEYISATVSAENVYDTEGLYGDKDAYLGQDLIFTFTPYTVQKNQNEYDADGQPTKAGEKINGWLCVDVKMDQIDWGEPAVTTTDNLEQRESDAQILFAAEDKTLKIDEISTALHMIGQTETASEEDANNPDQTSTDGKSGEDIADGADETNGADDAVASTDPAIEINAETYPAVSFEDSIVVRAGTLSTDNESAAKDTPEETTIAVSVSAEPETFPLGTAMVLGAVDDMDTVASAVEGAVEGQTRGFHAVDISFIDPDGNEIEPLKPIKVSMTSEAIKQAVEDSSTVPVVMHVENPENPVTSVGSMVEDATAVDPATADSVDPDSVESDAAADTAGSDTDMADTASASQTDAGATSDMDPADESGMRSQNETTTSVPTATIVETSETISAENNANKEEAADTLSFDAGSFSVYAIVYTVDFEYSVNGKMYQFSLPGGGFVSFTDLVEVLGIIGDTNSDENNAEIEEQITDGMLDVTASDAAKKFVADVESVEFSSPELVWVGKVDAETIVGALKEANGLECQYSAELTEEQIAEINSTAVESGDWALISMLPFSSEEELTVTMKDGEVFTIKVTDAQIKKTVIDAKGDTWEITVTYDDNAEIPDGAELKVKEILREDERYDEYYQQSLEKVGVVNVPENIEESDSEVTDETTAPSEEASATKGYAHIFDIQIWSGDQQIEPASGSAVAVSIKLLDAPEDENTDLKVVHFGKDGLEVMELAENDEETKAGGTELNFVTDEFSVYSVVDVNNSNISSLLADGSYALVTGIAADPGATVGYDETWGRDYFTIIVNAHAVMGYDGIVAIPETDDNTSWVEKTKGLGAEGVHAWTDSDGNNYVGGGATLWQFESAGSGKYRIFTNDSGTKQYITHNNAEVSLTTNQASATAFSVTPSGDGTTVLIHDGNMYLRNNAGNANSDSGWAAWVGRNYILTDNASAPSGNEYKFRLCEKSDDFDSFAAQKVAASTITTNTNYIIYRKFEDEQGKEALYALAHDGTFVLVYDGGDTIYWRETDKNIYWNYQINEKGYPLLFTQDPTTNETIYINPSHSEGQTLSTTANGLTLLGKDNGEYSTAIECWDQAAYDYAGLHVTLDNDGNAMLSTGTRVAGTSDEFLFAVASHMPGATAETVATVDSDSLGIKITMFDYGDANGDYAAGDKLDEMTAVAGSAEYTPHAAHALVKAYLESGLPSGSNGAMTGLFTAGGSAVTYSQTDVNHLFLQSYYDENGTFRYRSEDNYAYLGLDGNTDFTVYRQAATPYTTDQEPGHTYYYHGHFMPYNQIDMNNNLSRLMNQYGNEYTNGTAVGEIPLEDGRTYEDIYGVVGTPNFYTGMMMEAKFTQPRDGKLDNGDDMVFKFTGDDDMWVYIDGILVLDIGGIHEPLSGTINFATGVVANPAGSSLAGTTTLKQIFMNVRNADDTPQEVKDKIDAIVWDGDTFADYTNHDFKAFYMERGAGASNLDIQFNLKVTRTNEFTVEKEIPEGVDERFANQTYKFQATYKDSEGNEHPLHAGIENVCTAVVYKDTNDPVTVDENGYFCLKAGEAAVFKMADESIRYNVKEVEIDRVLIEQVDINGQQVTVTDGTAEAGYAMVEDRTQVTVTNHPKTQNLLITKHLTEDSAPLVEGENPVFEFRVYLETTVSKEDGTTQQQLVPYSYGPYYLVKEVDGETHYFTLTGVNNAPVDKGTEPVVCSTTGRSGSINSIPPEYTIIIPDLVVGTNFYVEERRDNIPEGYEFVREELKEASCKI